MAILRERIQTPLAIEETFDFIADFANASQWDPGVATSRRIGEGPLRVGTRYRLGVRVGRRVLPMDYRVVTLAPSRLVTLVGEGRGVAAVDEIQFTSLEDGGTAIDYLADIRLTGLLRLLTPFARGAFDRIARNAREGMERALDARAARTPSAATTAGAA
jgi:hypothetical protein